jgi:peptide/nickel transport system substrate-binding protein
MRLKRNWLNGTILSLLLVLALLVSACAGASPAGSSDEAAMEEEAASDEAASDIPDANLAVNPATVGSDRLLILPGRGRFGVGVWGLVTASNWNFSSESYYMVNMPLIFLGPLGNSMPTPWLAMRTDPVDDRMALEIELYEEGQWSDGETITTEDVSFTLHLLYHADADYWLGDARGMVPNVTGGQDYYDGTADSISGIVIIDDFNMRIEFDTPMGDIWRDLGMISILPEHHLGGYTAEQLWAGDFPDAWMPAVSSGPYRVVKFDDEAKYLENERWEEWWGNSIYGKPGIKRYAEQSGLALAHFLEGQSDMVKIGATDFDTVKDLPDTAIHPRTFMMTGYGLNRLEDRKLSRKVMDAIAYAIDREVWAEVLYFGFGNPEDSIFGLRGQETAQDSFCADCDDSLVVPRQFDPEKSKQLLAEAETEGDWDPDRVLILLGRSGGEAPVLLQQQLAAVGIQTEILAGRELGEERSKSGDYDIRVEGGYVSNTVRNCEYWVGNCEQDHGPTTYHWCNEDFRNMCNVAMSTTDPDEFTRASAELMSIYFNDGPVWGVTQIAEFYVMTDDLGGFIPEEAFNWLGTSGEKGVVSWYWLE